jgi:hypothetical protein
MPEALPGSRPVMYILEWNSQTELIDRISKLQLQIKVGNYDEWTENKTCQKAYSY